MQTEHIIKCAMAPYQLALTQIVSKASSEGGLRGISLHNPLMEMRNICNHPFTSALHVQVLSAELILPLYKQENHQATTKHLLTINNDFAFVDQGQGSQILQDCKEPC